MPDDSENARLHLRCMAFHEAGHAVVAWCLKLPVGDIHIHEIGAGNGGAQIGCADHLPLVDRIAICFAGIEAGKVFQSPQPPWAGHADRILAFDLVKGMSDEHAEQVWDHGMVRASELLAEHKNKVVLLANRLVEARRVDPAEFLCLMNA